MAKIGKLLILCALALLPTLAEAGPRLTVVATPNPVSEGDSLQLNIEVSVDDIAHSFPPQFDAPDFTIAGRGQSGGSSSSMVNGKITVETRMTYSYILMPRKSGDFTIRNITMRVGSDTLHAEDLRVKVLPDADGNNNSSNAAEEEDDASNPAAPHAFQGRPSAPAAGRKGGDSPNAFNSDFTVHAGVSKRSVVVGEPIVVEYYVYDFGGIRQLEVQKWPTFNGFWKDDLELVQKVDFEDAYVGSQRTRRAFLGRFALSAIKPGKISLDKLTVRASYVTRNSPVQDDDDPFGGFFSFAATRTGIHASQDVVIDVQPLPQEGRPANFGGAVGQFSLRLEADKNSVPANTPITITATLEGRGNFQSIDALKVPFPADFELYESTAKIQVPPGPRHGVESKKTFQYIVIPRKQGTFQIPAISWSYYDSEKKSYASLSTKPLELTVTEGAANTGEPANSYLDSSKAPVVTEDLRYLKPVGEFTTAKWPTALRLIIVALLALNFGLLLLYTRKKAGSLSSVVRRLDPLQGAKKTLAKIKDSHSKNWLSELEECLFQVIETLLKINPRGMTRGELEETWKASGKSFELHKKMQEILEALDRERFATSKSVQIETELKSRLVRSTEEIIQLASSKKG